MPSFKSIFLSIFLLTCTVLVPAQVSVNKNDSVIFSYIEKYKQIAMEEMQRTGVPACITLAQGIVESNAGRSELTTKSNNHFGIKCNTNWEGGRVYHDDDAVGECFRKYTDAEQSFRDHSDFLKNRSRYAELFTFGPLDYISWAHGLRLAGYATDKNYAYKLIRSIEFYNLNQYSELANDSQRWQEYLVLQKTAPKTDSLTSLRPSVDTPRLQKNTTSIPLPLDSPLAKSKYLYQPDMAKIFRINSVPVIYVDSNTSLLNIAITHDIPLEFLYEYNDLIYLSSNNDLLLKPSLVYLKKKMKMSRSKTYVMAKEGKTLYDIAQEEGVVLMNLLTYNNKKEGLLKKDEKIYLQPLRKNADLTLK